MAQRAEGTRQPGGVRHRRILVWAVLVMPLLGLAAWVPDLAGGGDGNGWVAAAQGGPTSPAANTTGRGPGDASDPPGGGPVADATAGPAVRVEVGTHLISFGGYDFAKGTYVMDAYLHFRWDAGRAPPGFTPEKFEFVNGRAASREQLSDEADAAGMRDLWFRVQANLYSPPDFAWYPFDTQRLHMTMEDTVHPVEALVYVPLDGKTTVDPDVAVAGWIVKGWSVEQTTKSYPFEESYSRLDYTLEVTRYRASSALRSFLPPVAFMLVASFSFFFDRSQAPARLTLGTGMLISAVGFHISQTVGLPALGQLSLFDKVMIASYAFIASTILVTTVLSWGERLRLPEKVSKLVNTRGAVLAVIVPTLVFLLLLLV